MVSPVLLVIFLSKKVRLRFPKKAKHLIRRLKRLWKAMQIDWNGDILQCCEGAVWSRPIIYEKMLTGKIKLMDIWNGPEAVQMRRTMSQKGRGAIPICAGCLRTGVSFKW